MGKSRVNRRGLTREQQLLKENQALKRDCQRLRKQLARTELNRYENVKEAVEEHARNSGLPTTEDLLEGLKREWACRKGDCTGYLEAITYNKIDKVYYYRQCNSCSNRTKSQKFDSKSFRGIIKKVEEK